MFCMPRRHGLGEESMGTKGRRSSYKFTGKTQSKRGILALVLSAASIAAFLILVFLSFQSGGHGTLYAGSAGVCSMLLSAAAFVLAVLSLREEDSFQTIPCLATAISFLSLGIWVALYVIGFLL